MTSLMTVSVTESELRTSCETGQHAFRKRSSEIFDTGVKSWGKGTAFAERIEVTNSVLSEMRTGKRNVHFHHVLALLEEPAAAHVVIGGQCSLAGLAQPRLEVTVELSAAEARLLAFLKQTPVWGMFLGELVARQFYHVSRELLDVAIEEAGRR